MKFRIAAALLALAGLVAAPAAVGTATAAGGVATHVKAAPSTYKPAAGFRVPVRGHVNGPRRKVALIALHQGSWRLIDTARTNRRGRYTLWDKVTSTAKTYRVAAPPTGRFSGGYSGRFTVRPTSVDKDVRRVFRRRCENVPDKSNTWDITFTTVLVSGERLRPTLQVSGIPYVGTLRTSYGGAYDVDTNFHRECQ